MKTIELKLKKYVLIVEAPLDAYDVSIGTHCIGVRTNENVEKDTNGFYHIYKKGLFFGDIDMKLEFICKGSELTEEIASELVDKSSFVEYRWYHLAKRGFKANVESKGFYWLENPIEKPHNIGLLDLYPTGDILMDKSLECAKKWQEAEEKTFRNPLIFVKK